MESMIATSAKIEERKRKNREAVKKAQNKKEQCMKELVNEKSSLESNIKRYNEESVVDEENQKAYDLDTTYLGAGTTILEQYENLLSEYHIMRHGK